MEQINLYPLMISSLTRKIMEKTMGGVDFSGEEKTLKLIVRRLENIIIFLQPGVSHARVSDWWIRCWLRKNMPAWQRSNRLSARNLLFQYFWHRKYIASLERGELPLQAPAVLIFMIRWVTISWWNFSAQKLDISAMQKKYDGKFFKTMWKE